MSTNFGAVAQDYATFRAGFPDSLFDRLASLGVRAEGRDVVDIGTCTGTLARGFARRGARVTAVDPDERMLEQAKQLDSLAQVTIEYKVGRAEALPLADGVADIGCAGQCSHWFDGPMAAREMARIVRPGGRVVIAHFD
jgi:ubiquinone/menaquinone biosynthesis C-methylase UbiE